MSAVVVVQSRPNYDLVAKASYYKDSFRGYHGYYGREIIRRKLIGIARENKISVTEQEMISTVVYVEHHFNK